MFNESALILAAGMPRSASTWLYNAARLLISSSPSIAQHLGCGWIGDWRNLPKRRYMLIKVHNYDQNLVNQANCILYSYRDIRDAMASGFRKFGQVPSVEAADRLVIQHEHWMDAANVVMRYESMLCDKEDVITQLMDVFDLHIADSADLVASIEKLSYDSEGPKNSAYHSANLYHRGHITDGGSGTWKGIIDPGLIKQIEVKHKSWFEKYGYSSEV